MRKNIPTAAVVSNPAMSKLCFARGSVWPIMRPIPDTVAGSQGGPWIV